MSNDIIIAIDGYSSCGKSTLARQLAAALDYTYIDTGAMYRAVTLYLLDNDIALDDAAAVDKALSAIQLEFKPVGDARHIHLNGRDVEQDIRTMRVSEHVSPVAARSAVRRAMVAQQQAMGRARGVVLDGRDIGTVVFPEAELKIFMTASIEVRTRRRLQELEAKGIDVDAQEVGANLMKRDHIDSTRADSPLRQADDARILDNSEMEREEQLALALGWAKEMTKP